MINRTSKKDRSTGKYIPAGASPTGPAGGDLEGTYPNPGIRDGVISDSKITDVNWAKIFGAPTELPPTGPAGGELSGTYPNPTLVNSAVILKLLTGLNIVGSTITATDSILTAFGKIQNQINLLVGANIYQGTWNASTNTPTLSDGTGTKGHFYVVSTGGTINLGSGAINFNVGDWAIHNGTIYEKVDNTDAVFTVNGYIGNVNLTTTDIPEATNLYWTLARFNAAFSTKSTSDLAEGSNLYFTVARVLASTLTGYSSTTGTITSSDTVLSAIQKLNGNLVALLSLQNVGDLINSATTKTTPVDADQIGLMDSAGGNILKKLSWANIKATLLTYFQSIFVTGKRIYLTGDYTNATTSLTDVFSFAALAGETWLCEAIITTNKSVTSGVRIAVDGPSGATVTGWYMTGGASQSTALINKYFDALSTAGESNTFGTGSGIDTLSICHFRITLGANSGNIKFQARSFTSGTVTIKAGSFMKADKVV